MDSVIEQWFARRTWQEPRWTVEELVAAKAGRRVAVVLPALDEEATVGAIVAAIVPLTRGPAPLVDELVVIDSGSTDRTAVVAAAAGARVVRRTEVLPHLEPVPGKGEVLWRSLAATDSDIVCFLDSDLIDFDPSFVPALLGPLLTAPGVHLVKGLYRRPLRLETARADTGGGRVTELLVRPLLAALRPELAGIVQPLGGEYAGTRELLSALPFAAGYGVEVGLLLDAHATRGLDALAQVNLGVRKHRNRSLLQLGVMARQILGAVLARCAPDAVADPDGPATLVQFLQVDQEWLPASTAVSLLERPPMSELASESVSQRFAKRPTERSEGVR